MKCKISIFLFGIVFLLKSSLVFADTKKPQQPQTKNNPQIERGQPNFIFDFLGNIISLPKKIILLNLKIDNHYIRPETEELIKEYIKDNPNYMKDTKVRLNQFSLFGDLKRLTKNKKVSWYWRIFPGIPVTIFASGFGRLVGGDHYNPFSDTINIYSDIPAVALHEAGHAKEAAKAYDEGMADFYAIGRIFVPVTLYQEFAASDEAIAYLKEKEKREDELNSYQVLYPAYGTYVGGYSGLPYGEVAGAIVGQGFGLWAKRDQRITYEALDSAKEVGEVVTDLKSDPIASVLIKYNDYTHQVLLQACKQ